MDDRYEPGDVLVLKYTRDGTHDFAVVDRPNGPVIDRVDLNSGDSVIVLHYTNAEEINHLDKLNSVPGQWVRVTLLTQCGRLIERDGHPRNLQNIFKCLTRKVSLH